MAFAFSVALFLALAGADDAPPAVVDDRAAAAVEDVPTATDDGARADDRPAVALDTAAPVDDREPSAQPAPVATDVTPARLLPDTARVIDEQSEVVGEPGGNVATPPAAPPSAPTETEPVQMGIGFSGIPAVNYIADNGLGLGAIGAVYVHDGMTLPYRTGITLQIFATTRLVQDHNLIVDALRVFDLPLRVNARFGYLSSLTQNFCGFGGDLPCDPAEAERAARDAGLVDDDDDDDDAFDAFVRHYYQRRFVNPYGLVNLRYALIDRSPGQPTRVELLAGYRAFYFIPGDVFSDDDGDGAPDLAPYAGSLYAKQFPDGEPGLSSVVQVGVLLDSRDREPSPTSGWFNELTVRASTPGLSTWSYGGFNATLRGFTHVPATLPFLGDPGRRLVLANRFTVDGVVGDIPVQELARLGGTQDVYAFGGADVGRGIRVQRFLGKLKIIDQAEVRYRFAETPILGQEFAWTLAGFIDAAIVGDELLGPRNVGVAAGGGGALRVAWNENFVIRVDLGISPLEGWALQPYVTINQPF